MGTASSIFNYIDSTGTIVPDTSDILTTVQTQYTDVFGADLNLDPTTPQGVLITAETLAFASVAQNNAALANQINPNLSGGVFLDAVGGMTGIERTAQSQTAVANVTITGVAGTVIPQGSQAQTAAGDIFQTLGSVTLASNGTGTVDFSSVAYGPIPCAVGALTQIVSSVLGWETVTNPIAGVLGSTTQSDESFRAYRLNTMFFQGVALPGAIESALYATPGVTSVLFQENVSWQTTTINGISMTPKSIYACVAGGTDTAVAAAILENKSSGCGYNGGTTVNIIEPTSGQTYAVQFDRPAQVGILIEITTPNGNAANINAAVLAYAAGQVAGLVGFVVGAAVSPFEIAAGIIAQYPSYTITSVKISYLSPVSYVASTLPIAVNAQAYTQQSFIGVAVG